MIEGKVETIEDCGTVVQVFLRDERGGIHAIPFDHRMFRAFYDSEGPLKGRTLRYDPEHASVEVVE